MTIVRIVKRTKLISTGYTSRRPSPRQMLPFNGPSSLDAPKSVSSLVRLSHNFSEDDVGNAVDTNIYTGKGLHSQGGSAKIRPAIEELMRKYDFFLPFSKISIPDEPLL